MRLSFLFILGLIFLGTFALRRSEEYHQQGISTQMSIRNGVTTYRVTYTDDQGQKTVKSGLNQQQYEDYLDSIGFGDGSNQSIEQKRSAQLEKHNEYRRMHSAPDLTISDELNERAQAYAQELQATDAWQHSNCTLDDGRSIGQNLYKSSKPPKGGYASKSWYDQIKLYDFSQPDFTSGTGHFTQLVWAGSTEVGFGYAGGYVVANYYPAGNVIGQFGQNVHQN